MPRFLVRRAPDENQKHDDDSEFVIELDDIATLHVANELRQVVVQVAKGKVPFRRAKELARKLESK